VTLPNTVKIPLGPAATAILVTFTPVAGAVRRPVAVGAAVALGRVKRLGAPVAMPTGVAEPDPFAESAPATMELMAPIPDAWRATGR
jgi:hypothetical protein